MSYASALQDGVQQSHEANLQVMKRFEPASNSDYVKTGRISKKWQVDAHKRPHKILEPRAKGFKNPMSWCYRRATMQALLHVPGFFSFLNRYHVGCSVTMQNMSECIFCSFRELARVYWMRNDNASRAGAVSRFDNAFRKAIHREAKDGEPAPAELALLNQQIQSDAQEFFVQLVSLLEKVEHQNDLNLRTEGLFILHTSNDSSCPDCGLVLSRREDSLGQLLEIDKSVKNGTSIVELLVKARRSTLSTACQSDACRAANMPDREREETRHIFNGNDVKTKAPEILVVYLKRFQVNYETEGLDTEKMEQRIAFPLELKLNPFTKDGSSLKYRLHAIVAHAGSSATGGHYIVAVRNQDDDKNWTFISDKDVYAFVGGNMGSLSNMKLPDYGDEVFNPYLIFYQKLGPDEE